MAGVEKYEHEVGKVDDVIREAQRRGALRIGIESRGVDQDLTPQTLAGAGFELQIGVDPVAFALGHRFDFVRHLVEGESWIGIQCNARQRMGRVLPAIADDGELVVDGLVAGAL